MKNLINFKSILVYSMCIAGTFFLASSCSENKTVDSMEVAEDENMSKSAIDDQAIVGVDNDNDAKFLMEAAEMQMEAISLGKLAQQKGTSSHVKDLGKMMESDHSKSMTELEVLAQSNSIAIPTSATENSQDAYEKLEDETGNEFGKKYSKMMVEHHEDAIGLYEKAASDSENPEIRTWASEQLPGLRTHLEEAKACKEECDKMK